MCLFHGVLCGTCFVFYFGGFAKCNCFLIYVCLCFPGMHIVLLFVFVKNSACMSWIRALRLCKVVCVLVGVSRSVCRAACFFVFWVFVLLSILQSIHVRNAIYICHVLAGHSLRWFVCLLFCCACVV